MKQEKAYGSITITDVMDGKEGAGVKAVITTYSGTQEQLNSWVQQETDRYLNAYIVGGISSYNIKQNDTVMLRVTNTTKNSYAYVVATVISVTNDVITVKPHSLLDNGESGDTGRGVKEETRLYYKSTSSTQPPETPDTQPESALYWKEDFPTTWSSNIHIWTITKTEWTDGTVTYTTPRLLSQIEAATLSAQLSHKSLSEWCALNNVTIIDGSTIATGTVDAVQLKANAVIADKIAADAITADKIRANAITADKVDIRELSAISANLGLIESGSIRSPGYGDIVTWTVDNNSKNLSYAQYFDEHGTFIGYEVRGIGGNTDSDVVIPSTHKGLPVIRIAQAAFANCHMVTVTIPDSVTSIDYRAFALCKSLESVTIGNSVESIGDYAFTNCTSLKSITIPDSVKSIEERAFNYCTSLKSAIIGNSVESIGDGAFCACESLESVTIPDSVTSIGYGAFSDCTGLTSITIPDSVLSIGDSAFLSCASLTRVSLGNNVTTIGGEAFRGTALVDIVISDSITNIGENALYYCKKLTHIYYKGTSEQWDNISVGTLGTDATIYYYSQTMPTTLGEFWYYDDSGEIVVWSEYDISNYSEGLLFSNNKDGTASVRIGTCKDMNIIIPPVSPDGQPVTSVRTNAFANSDIESVIIPDSVTSISSAAFTGCEYLKSIVIPNSVVSIGSSAFSGCTSLKTIALPNSITNIEAYTFNGCRILANIIIPSSVTSIGDQAFYDCPRLTNVYYGGTTAQWSNIEIGLNNSNLVDAAKYYYSTTKPTTEGNFWYYDQNGKVTLWTEDDSDYSKGLQFSSNGDGTCYIVGPGFCTDTDIIIPPISPNGDSVTSIGYSAFSGYNGLTSITIPTSIVSIGSSAFSSCSNLTTVHYKGNEAQWQKIEVGYGNYYLDNAEKYYYGYSEGFVFIYNGDSTCSIVSRGICNDSKIIIPPTSPDGRIVISIGSGAFKGSDIYSVVIPDSVTSIDESAFAYCRGLTSVTIPDSVTSIGNGAFSHCTSLKSITIPNGITSISDHMFYACGDITSMSIPDGVTSIGQYAFYDCDGLTSITIGKGVTNIGNNAFDGCRSLISITVRSGNMTYKSIENNLYSADGKNLIKYAAGKTEISFIIPDGVTTIEVGAFRQCRSLENILIPNSAISIGNGAFYNCSNLASVTIPDSINSIGDNAFYGCENLVSVKIGNGVVNIGNYAFHGCNKLTDVLLGKSIQIIGRYAFATCYMLTDIYYTGGVNDWSKVNVESPHDDLGGATVYCYTETQPNTDGNFWSYQSKGFKISCTGSHMIDSPYFKVSQDGKIEASEAIIKGHLIAQRLTIGDDVDISDMKNRLGVSDALDAANKAQETAAGAQETAAGAQETAAGAQDTAARASEEVAKVNAALAAKVNISDGEIYNSLYADTDETTPYSDAGMKISLKDNYIKTPYFALNSDGAYFQGTIVAKSGGTIGGFGIEDNGLVSDSVELTTSHALFKTAKFSLNNYVNMFNDDTNRASYITTTGEREFVIQSSNGAGIKFLANQNNEQVSHTVTITAVLDRIPNGTNGVDFLLKFQYSIANGAISQVPLPYTIYYQHFSGITGQITTYKSIDIKIPANSNNGTCEQTVSGSANQQGSNAPGSLISWSKDGTYANSITTKILAKGTNNILYSLGSFNPMDSDKYFLGNDDKVWKSIRVAAPNIVSSDIRLKNSIVNIPDKYEAFFDNLVPVSYKYNNNDSDRMHIGFIAQEVEKSLNNAGIATKDFAGICIGTDEDKTYALRYEEFIPLNTFEIQKLKKRVAELEAKLSEFTT